MHEDAGVSFTNEFSKVRFITATDLMMSLTAAHRQNQLADALKRLDNPYRLLILDEIGYLPMSREQANLFFRVIAKLYEQGSLIVTSNPPSCQWDKTFADDAGSIAASRSCPAVSGRQLSAARQATCRHDCGKASTERR